MEASSRFCRSTLLSLVLSVPLVLLGCSSSSSENGGTAGKQSSGGSTSSGGTSSSGGVANTGGVVISGGTAGAGGGGGTGGVTTSGGATAGTTGGTTATGGKAGAGGTAIGGTTSTAGTAAGGAAGAGGGAGAAGAAGAGSGGSVSGGSGGSTGGSGGGAVKSAGCGKTSALKNSPATTANYNTVSVGGTDRKYILRLPENYDNTHPYRLILSYHWATGSANQVFNCHSEGIDCYTTQSPFFGLLALANNSTIFIAPDGTGGLWTNPNGQDVAFTDEILKQVEADLCIDTSRIELEGFSMGGAMVMTLICQRPGVFRAAVTHSAGGQAKPATCDPIPYFATLGSQEGGGQTSTADLFAKWNGCTAETLPKPPSGGHVCSDYKGCSDGHPVRWCPFDGGHTPSPRDSGQSSTWMPKEVWSFLSQY
jgi:poly(3-hydroxybutyrate) depolymerase